MGSKKLHEVVCLIFERNGKLLLERRLDADTHGHWTFTGGKVEPEDFINGQDYKTLASIREAVEETNLTPLECECLETFREVSVTGKAYIFHSILIKSWDGKLRNREAHRRKLRWIPLKTVTSQIGENKVDLRVLAAFNKANNSVSGKQRSK
ncbi:NUDIX hydrolase [Candidatus Microgenomates bacterium]|nr:NUDIX hydrolase [Candidatus Microgenomates bacterium]